jgi:hypothetical protein
MFGLRERQPVKNNDTAHNMRVNSPAWTTRPGGTHGVNHWLRNSYINTDVHYHSHPPYSQSQSSKYSGSSYSGAGLPPSPATTMSSPPWQVLSWKWDLQHDVQTGKTIASGAADLSLTQLVLVG